MALFTFSFTFSFTRTSNNYSSNCFASSSYKWNFFFKIITNFTNFAIIIYPLIFLLIITLIITESINTNSIIFIASNISKGFIIIYFFIICLFMNISISSNLWSSTVLAISSVSHHWKNQIYYLYHLYRIMNFFETILHLIFFFLFFFFFWFFLLPASSICFCSSFSYSFLLFLLSPYSSLWIISNSCWVTVITLPNSLFWSSNHLSSASCSSVCWICSA